MIRKEQAAAKNKKEIYIRGFKITFGLGCNDMLTVFLE